MKAAGGGEPHTEPLGSMFFMCFADPETGERRCEVDVSPPGEMEHLEARRREYGAAHHAEHSDFPDWLSDDMLDLFDRWRSEYRAWYAAQKAEQEEADRRRSAMRAALLGP